MYNIYLDNLHVSEKCEKVVDTSLPQRSCPQFGALPLKKLGQLDCLRLARTTTMTILRKLYEVC